MAPSSIDQANSLYAQLPLQLGVPLPPGHNHALSVSMPTWDDVVGYEEGRPETVKALACGYPRFFRHPFVVRLVAHLKANVAPFDQLASDEWNLMVLPTEAVATRLHKFLATQPEVALNDQKHITVHNVRDGLVYVVVFPVSLTQTANRYWQHTGEIVTSRHAELILKTLTDEASDVKLQLQSTAAHTTVRERVAQLHFGPENAQENAHNVFLYPTGMGAIFAALRLLTQFNQDGKAILFGFPYLDSLKQLQRSQWCPGGVHFFPVPGDAELAQVEAILKTEKVLGIFTEFPCNPLLSVPDLERLAALAHAHGTYVVVDDTVASYNLNPMKYGAADLVVTSLSKIFSGSCTVMGGSLVVSPQSQAYTKFQNHLATTNDSFLLDRDAQELADASTDVRARLARMNATTSLLVQRLQQERLVKSLFYPQLSDDADRYHRFLMLPDASVNQFGPLFSIVLHGGERVARAFYDNLKVAKGPSLGTNFTLACPYTLLAHYYELDYVESCGVDRHLVRISIGLEDPELLWKALQDALRVAESVFQRE